MPLHVPVKRAITFPAVIKAWKKPGALLKAVKKAASYSRRAPSTNSSRLGGQLDIQGITKVPSLKKNGHR